LKSKYNINGFAIIDDNFIINKKNVLEICHEITDLNLSWSALSRIDTINNELLKTMKKAGLIEVKYGIESGNNTLLQSMGKNINIKQISDVLKITKNNGILVKIFIIHGFPGENNKTTKDTINFLHENKSLIDRVSLFRFVPLPGSYIFSNHQKYNIILSENWDDYHIYHNDKHWWGSRKDYKILQESYKAIKDFIDNTWS